jgi:hypothetical protein
VNSFFALLNAIFNLIVLLEFENLLANQEYFSVLKAVSSDAGTKHVNQ